MSLKSYVATRVAYGLLMIFILLNLVFFVVRILPGNPAVALAPVGATPQQIAVLAHQLGLDRPIQDQYVSYMTQFFTGNMGQSFNADRPVLYLVEVAFPITIQLALGSIVFAAIVGILGGVLSASGGALRDNAIRVWNLVWYATPIFWLGPLLQILLGLDLHVLPVAGAIDPTISLQTITGMPVVDSLLTLNLHALESAVTHMILPVVTLGLLISGSISRISRQEMRQAFNSDYMVLAKAKGLSPYSYMIRHWLRSVSLPIVTIVGLEFASILGGAVLTESVFNLPGMGTLLISALNARDYPTMQAVLALSVLWVGIVTIALDILYVLLDPRLR